MGHKVGHNGETVYNQRTNNERIQDHPMVGELISKTV